MGVPVVIRGIAARVDGTGGGSDSGGQGKLVGDSFVVINAVEAS